MSWIDSHKDSEELASAAHLARRGGDRATARDLFVQAAKAEEAALLSVDPKSKPRTFAITAVSAVALWYKGGDLARAEALAHQVLSHHIEDFAVRQLRSLIQTIWNVQAQVAAGIKFVPGQVQVSVKGGEIVTGGAPLDLIVEKVQTIQSIFYRTTEWIRQMPHRRRGPATKEIQDSCRPWLFQGVPASYQFVVAIQSPPQTDWVSPTQYTDPQLVADTFLSIIKTSIDDPGEGLSKLIPDKEYKATFLKLTRSLAPNGKAFGQLEMQAAGEASPVVLLPDSRKVIGQTLKAEAPPSSDEMEPTQITGVLRALHLDQDWIEVMVDGKPIRINNVGEATDDVIGPMVNHSVVVQALKDRKDKFHFRDIERDE